MGRSVVLALALALAARALAEVEECQGGDGEEASLLQSKVRQDRSEQKCFSVDLVADPVAAPDIKTDGTATAKILVAADEVTVTSMSWTIPNVSSENPIIGLHIHDGDHSENGGILVGFCGSSPLPTFSGICPDYTSADATLSTAEIEGEGCDLGNATQGGPCVAAKGTSEATIEGAAQKILSAADPYHEFYLNLHTKDSFYINKAANGGHANPIGLIRGQLSPVGC